MRGIGRRTPDVDFESRRRGLVFYCREYEERREQAGIATMGAGAAMMGQKRASSRHDSRCNYRVLRLVAGAAGVCQLGRGRFEADCKPV
jgi:hypothetical protein